MEGYDPDYTLNEWGEWVVEDAGIRYTLSNGDQVFGPDFAGELCTFVFGARLNERGQALFENLGELVKMGLVELRDGKQAGRFLDVAPWHGRDV